MFPAYCQAQDPTFFPDYIGGLVLMNDSSSPGTVLDVSPGAAVDSTATTFIKLPSFSKNITCPWVAGNGACGMAPGVIVAPNNWYAVFAIANGGLSDVYFDAIARDPSGNPTVANPPAGTTAWRHLGWIMTDSSSNIIGFLCDGNDHCEWKNFQGNMLTGTYDYHAVNPCNTVTATPPGSPTSCYFLIRPAHIPPGKVEADFNLNIANLSIPQVALRVFLLDPDLPSGSDPAGVLNGIGFCDTEPQLPITIECQARVTTDFFGQIKLQLNSNPAGSGQSGTTFNFDSRGWRYTRKRSPMPSPPPPGTIGTPVTIGSAGSSPGAYSNFSTPTTTAIIAGDIVGVCVGINSTNTVSVSSITIGGNTLTRDKQQVISPNSDIELWHVSNAAAVSSGTSISVGLSGSTGASSGVSIVAAQVSGVSTLDQIGGASGTTAASLTATTPALSQATELAFGCSYQVPPSTYSGSSGWNNIGFGAAPSGNETIWMDWYKPSSASPLSYNPTWASGTSRVGAAVGTFQ